MVESAVKKNNRDTCETFCFDEEKVNRIKPQIDEVVGVEMIFKALSDLTRLKIT